jgi:hypothetical protein
MVSAYQLELATVLMDWNDHAGADYWLQLSLDNCGDDSAAQTALQAKIRSALSDVQARENASAVRVWHGRYDPPVYAEK